MTVFPRTTLADSVLSDNTRSSRRNVPARRTRRSRTEKTSLCFRPTILPIAWERRIAIARHFQTKNILPILKTTIQSPGQETNTPHTSAH